MRGCTWGGRVSSFTEAGALLVRARSERPRRAPGTGCRCQRPGRSACPWARLKRTTPHAQRKHKDLGTDPTLGSDRGRRTFHVALLGENGRPLNDQTRPPCEPHFPEALAVRLWHEPDAHARWHSVQAHTRRRTRSAIPRQPPTETGLAAPTHLSLGSSRATLETCSGASREKMPPFWSPWLRTCFLT